MTIDLHYIISYKNYKFLLLDVLFISKTIKSYF